MRLASVLVSLCALAVACGDSSFSSDASDAGSSDASLGDASSDGSAASSDGGQASVALRDFSANSGELATDGGDTAVPINAPSGAQPSDLMIAVIALFEVQNDTGTSITAPPDWKPGGSFFNDTHGGNASVQWHVFAFATQVSSAGQTDDFTVSGFTAQPNPTSWYTKVIVYSGASVASLDFKDIIDTPDHFPYVSFPSVIVGANGSHVLTGMLTDYALPVPLVGLPPGASEIGSPFMEGLGRFTDQPVPIATTLDASTIPSPNDGGLLVWSTTFQFVVAPAN